MWIDTDYNDEDEFTPQRKVSEYLNSLNLLRHTSETYLQGDDVAELVEERLRKLRERPPPGTQASWFIGPGGENIDCLEHFISEVLTLHKEFRKNPVHVPFGENSDGYLQWLGTVNTKNSTEYEKAMAVLGDRLDFLVKTMNEGCVPFHSFSYLSHMLWDNTLPGVLGWFVGLLYNQNNVAAEASPLTTAMEIDLGRQLCRLMQFPNTPPPVIFGESDDYHGTSDPGPIPWGKITCDGSVANIESIWMARNFRFFSLALQSTLREHELLSNVRYHEDARVIATGDKRSKRFFADLNSWEVVNLKSDEFFNFLDRIAQLLTPAGQSDNAKGHVLLHNLVDSYDLRALGLVEFTQRHPVLANMPRVVAPGTKHYSWPKGMTMLGFGHNQLIDVSVGLDGRMDLNALDEEIEALKEQRIPLLMAVSVHGTTTEGAIDPLALSLIHI